MADPNDTAEFDLSTVPAPEQPPMDDASGGPTVDEDDDSMDETSTEDLSVQGGD